MNSYAIFLLQLSKRKTLNVKISSHSILFQDCPGTIKAIAQFLNRPLDDTTCEAIAHATHFKRTAPTFKEIWTRAGNDSMAKLYRKGEVSLYLRNTCDILPKVIFETKLTHFNWLKFTYIFCFNFGTNSCFFHFLSFSKY